MERRDGEGKGLVDHLGGIMDAVAAAKVRGGLEGDDYDLVIASGDGSMLSVAIGAAAPQSLLDQEISQRPA